MIAVERMERPPHPGPAPERLHPLLPPKIRPAHLERLAVVYVRQSTGQQVLEHRESSALQYAVAGGAVGLARAAGGGDRPRPGSQRGHR